MTTSMTTATMMIGGWLTVSPVSHSFGVGGGGMEVVSFESDVSPTNTSPSWLSHEFETDKSDLMPSC